LKRIKKIPRYTIKHWMTRMMTIILSMMIVSTPLFSFGPRKGEGMDEEGEKKKVD